MIKDILKGIAAAVVAVIVGYVGVKGVAPSDPSKYSLWYDLTHKDRIDYIVMGEHYGSLAFYWRDEVSRRYSDAVIILAHGGPFPKFEDGRISFPWSGADDITGEILPWETIVDQVRERHPHRRIVVISCNPLHQYLPRKRVTYALDNVWFYPDSMQRVSLNDVSGQRYAGDIYRDFIEQ